ncbi:MAG TPA: hypothetical protein DCY91_29550 [Cyanobacteria bacterium UBA11370]|nr:hypothetical protein [Cyanobacteria bacterium UBA11370]
MAAEGEIDSKANAFRKAKGYADGITMIWRWIIDLLHKSEKPLPSPPRNGEGARFLPPASGGLRGVDLTFARGLIK